MRSRFCLSVALTGLAISTIAAPSRAADTSDAKSAPPTRSGTLAEVVVTAQRRAEVSSKVPMTIAAFTGAMLQKRSVIQETDLQALVPGLTVNTGASANQLNYSIRGQALDPFSGSSPGVLPYMNDVAMPTDTEASTAFYDLTSVQVLKGPQGTLFGRNDTGGAILFDTVQPDDQWGGFVTARFGSYSMRQYQGAVNIPVIPGKLDVRLAGDSLQSTGYVTNLVNGQHLGDTDSKSGRLSVKYMPTDTLTNTSVLQYNTATGTENNPLVYSVYSPGQTNGQGQLLNDNAYVFSNGAIVPYLQLQRSRGYLQAEIDGVPAHDSHGLLFQNTTVYDVARETQIKNILGMSSSDSDSRNFFSGAPFEILSALNPFTGHGNESHQMLESDELQLLGRTAGEQLKYIVGGYFSYSSNHQYEPLDFGPVPFFSHDYRTFDVSRAVFGQGTYDLSRLTAVHGLSFTAGVRYTWEMLGNRQEAHTLYPGAPHQSFAEKHPSWQLGLQYQVTPHELLYVVTRGSWRAGGFNDNDPANNLNEFRNEQSHDVEVGSKFSGRLLGRAARVNLSAYEQVTDDAQRVLYVNLNGVVTGFTANVPQARVKGLELSGEMIAMQWLRVGADVSFSNPRWSEPFATVFGQQYKFTQYADTPRWAGSVYAAATLPVPASIGAVTLRADDYAQAHEYFANVDLPGTSLPGYSLLNLRLQWDEIMRSNASVALYVKNALNRSYFAGGFSLGETIGENLAIAAQPRTFGVELDYDF